MSSNLFTHRLQFTLLIIIVIVGLFFIYLERTNQTLSHFSFMPIFTADYDIIRVGELSIEVEVANTPLSREKGLSGRSSLKENKAMLFVYPEAGYHGIWMKDMKFPIDVVWISEDFKVVDISRNLNPDSYPRIYEPKRPAKYALETEVLFVETFGIAIGQTVVIPEALQYSE